MFTDDSEGRIGKSGKRMPRAFCFLFDMLRQHTTHHQSIVSSQKEGHPFLILYHDYQSVELITGWPLGIQSPTSCLHESGDNDTLLLHIYMSWEGQILKIYKFI